MPPISRVFLLPLFASLLLAGIASAASCPAGEGQTVPRQAEALQDLARQLSAIEPECLENADYLAWYGAILNALGDIDAATVRLERALMLSPDLFAARIEYAVALGRSARWAEAVDLAGQLLAEPALPAALRLPLQGYVDYWKTHLPGFWGSAQLQLGYSNNLNSAPLQNSHSLTLGDQQMLLTLSPEETRRAGPMLLTELAGGHESQLDNGNHLYATGVLRARHSETWPQTDYLQLDSALNWTGFASHSRFNRSLGAGVQFLQSELVQSSLRSGAAYEYAASSCSLRSGTDLEWRHYPRRNSLDGIAPSLIFAVRCELPGHPAWLPGLQLRTERDYAHSDRPGGDQRRAELLLSLQNPLAGGWLETAASYQWQRDQNGYSVLLENNTIRQIDKKQARIDYRYPLATGWLALAGYNWAWQDSNLSLFRTREQSIWIGLRRQW